MQKEGFSVYLPEHCGHGFSYRLTEDESLVHLDSFERYVEDFIFVTKKAKEDNPGMKIYLYGHSMGGGIAAAVAARVPEMFEKVILSSPMIRPLTGGCRGMWQRRSQRHPARWEGTKKYVVGQKPYKEPGKFEESCSLSRPRFEYYEEKGRRKPIII
ncbi:MAG: alpha/beta fold hydrolase [Coprococcus sp.]